MQQQQPLNLLVRAEFTIVDGRLSVIVSVQPALRLLVYSFCMRAGRNHSLGKEFDVGNSRGNVLLRLLSYSALEYTEFKLI